MKYFSISPLFLVMTTVQLAGFMGFNSQLDTVIANVLPAIEQVESGGNVNAHNLSENAIGPLQIRPIMVADYNRIYKTSLPHTAAWDRETSIMIAYGIFRHYLKNKQNPTEKHCAFIWNGGGSSHIRADKIINDKKQQNLEKYWAKIKKNLQDNR